MRTTTAFIMAALLVPRLARTADGEALFRSCNACPSVNPKELQELPGPNLHGVFGRRALRGEEYSSAMREAGERGSVWSAAALDQFLAAPQSYIPKTTMTFPRRNNPADRKAVIDFLERAGQ